jgi:GGDEF domain-containing protein
LATSKGAAAMSSAHIALWSVVLGVYLTCIALSIAHSIVARNRSGWMDAGFIAVTGLAVVAVAGLPHALAPQSWVGTLDVVRIVSGPASVASGAFLLTAFLRARRRDALVQRGLLGVVFASVALALCGWMDDKHLALQIVEVGVIAGALCTTGLVVRAALLGDKLAWYMVVATLLMVISVLGLYALALGRINASWAWAIALCVVLYMMGSTLTVRQRTTQYLRMRRALEHDPNKDRLTQLITGHALVALVSSAIKRAQRSRKEVAIVCVEIFNTSALRKEFGVHALEEVIYTLAARLNRAAGAVVHVGRYTDTSFIVILDSLKQTSQLRTMGLRLASGARKPYVLHPFSADTRDFRADIGVGIARVSPASAGMRHDQTSFGTSLGSSSTEEALHDAAELATWSRNVASRCAIIDGITRRQIAIEDADFSA